MKKRISLTLDFTIEIHESHLDQPSHNQAEQAHYERLKRVLHAITSDKDRFHTFLQWQIAGFFELADWKDWYELFLGNREFRSQDAFDPAINTLDASDIQHFNEADNDGVFFESIEDVNDCFRTTLDRTEFVVEEDSL